MSLFESSRILYRDKHSYCGPISMLELGADGEYLVVFRQADWEGPEVTTHTHASTRTSLIRSKDGENWEGPVTVDAEGGNGTSIARLGNTLLVNNFRWKVVPTERREELEGLDFILEHPEIPIVSGLVGVFTMRSHDNGRHWETPRQLTVPEVKTMSTAGRAVELSDGSWLLPMSGHEIGDRRDVFPWFARSEDRGETWKFQGRCANPEGVERLTENRILALRDGRVLSLNRTEDGSFWQSFSEDGGATWSPLKDTSIPCLGSSPADLLHLPDGRILCTYGNRRREPLGIRACLSEDGGATWKLNEEILLRDDAVHRDMGYPSTKLLEDGRFFTVYYWQDADEVRHLVGSDWRLKG